jgi:hypothetical protein
MPGAGGTILGGIAVILFCVEWLRFFASGRFRAASPVAPWVCGALGLYAFQLMLVDPFLWYAGDAFFVRGILLLLPFLLAMSALIEGRAWLGVASSILFFAESLAMLIRNGCSRSGGTGFFGGWVF